MTETSRRGFEQPTPAEQAGGVQKESLCKWCLCCVDHLESHVKACLCRTFPAKSDWLREAARSGRSFTRAAAPTEPRKAKPGGHVQSDRLTEQEARCRAAYQAWHMREVRRRMT